MVQRPRKLILWIGPKHSGKTTAAGRLVRQLRCEGFSVAGLLAPAVYKRGQLIGFGAVNLQEQSRITIASQKTDSVTTPSVKFTEEGLRFGQAALSLSAAQSAELIIVDEFGPLELCGEAWRKEVDRLLAHSKAAVLLVVREKLVQQVKGLYRDHTILEIPAGKSSSIDEVMGILKQRRFVRERNDSA